MENNVCLPESLQHEIIYIKEHAIERKMCVKILLHMQAWRKELYTIYVRICVNMIEHFIH